MDCELETEIDERYAALPADDKALLLECGDRALWRLNQIGAGHNNDKGRGLLALRKKLTA